VKTVQKKEFMDLLKLGKTEATKSTPGKADWDAAIAEATKSGRSYTISQIHEDLVDGTVSRGRVRGKLDDLFKAKKVARLVIDGAYQYNFDPEVIKLQHGEE